MNYLLVAYAPNADGKMTEILPGLAATRPQAIAAAESLRKEGLAHGNIKVSHVVVYRKVPAGYVQDITIA